MANENEVGLCKYLHKNDARHFSRLLTDHCHIQLDEITFSNVRDQLIKNNCNSARRYAMK